MGQALDAARELLDMDIDYFSAFTGGDQVIRDVRGDRDAVVLEPGSHAHRCPEEPDRQEGREPVTV